MSWEEIRNDWLDELRQNDEALQRSVKKESAELTAKIKTNEYQIDSEIETDLETSAAVLKAEVKAIIKSAVVRTVNRATKKKSLRDPLISRLMKESVEKKYADGLNLSKRLWNWEQSQKKGLKKALAKGVKKGEQAEQLTYRMQRSIEKNRGLFARTSKEKIPKWLDQFQKQAKTVISSPEARADWNMTLKKVEGYLDGLAKKGTRYAGKDLYKQITQAVKEGNARLIDHTLNRWLYDKQLYSLRRIAYTESANAFHSAQIACTKDDDNVIGYAWRISKSHAKVDICDDWAAVDYGLGRGVWPKDKVPDSKPHPFCLCYLIPKTKQKL